MKNLRKILARRIKKLRAIKGITQENLAHEAKTSHRYIWGIENGKQNPSLDTLENIAIALNVPVSYLLLNNSDIETLQSLLKQSILPPQD